MQRISLNLIPGSVKPVVYASQYDKGRAIQFYVYNGDEIYNIPAGAWVICQGTKPDGKTFAYSSKDDSPKVSIAGSIITLTTTEQMTAVAGDASCEFAIHEGDGTTLGTLNFSLSIENGTLPADADTSLSDLAAYQNMADRTQASEAAAAASEKAAADSASKAEESHKATVKEHTDASADIQSLHTTAVNEITEKQSAAVTAVQTSQTTAENSIESKRSSAVSEIQQLIDNFNSGNYYTEDITINPSDWSGTDAPYSYTITNASDDMAVFLDIVEPGTTEDQMEAINAAGIYGSKTNTIYATGDKPNIAIPLRLIYLKGGN